MIKVKCSVVISEGPLSSKEFNQATSPFPIFPEKLYQNKRARATALEFKKIGKYMHFGKINLSVKAHLVFLFELCNHDHNGRSLLPDHLPEVGHGV